MKPWRGICIILLLNGSLTAVSLAQNKVWDKTLGGNSDDYVSSVQQTSDGGYILGGYSDSGMSGDKSEANKGEYDEFDNPTV